MTLQRAEELLRILKDPTVPNGSVIKLHNLQEYSPVKRAIDARARKNNEAFLDRARLLTED